MTHAHARTVALVACLVVAAAVAPVAGLVAPAGPADDSAAARSGGDAGPAAMRGATDERVATGTPDGWNDTGWDGENDSDWSVDAAAAGGMGTGSTAGGESTAGEAFASAVAAHDTELEGEVRRRAFDRRLAAVGNDTGRARVLRATVRSAELRLAVLDARRERLRVARRNGTISEGSYRVALVRLTTEARSLRQVIDRSEDAADRLPRATRAEYGLGSATFDELRSRADAVGNRSGTTLEGVAFEYDGTLDGGSLDDGSLDDGTLDEGSFDRSGWNGTLADGGDSLDGTDWYTENGSATTFENTTADGTEERYPERRMTLLTLDGNVTELQGVHDYLADRSDGDPEVEEALACARDALDETRAAVDDARAALDEGEPARADDRIADARAALTTARDCLEQARAALQDDDDGGSTSTPSRTATPTSWSGTK